MYVQRVRVIGGYGSMIYRAVMYTGFLTLPDVLLQKKKGESGAERRERRDIFIDEFIQALTREANTYC